MPTVIDSLVVTLGLNAKAFTQGAKTANAAFKQTGAQATQTAKGIEESGKQAAFFFSKLRNEALTFFAVFTAGVGFKDFLSSTITGSASLGRMAANLQMGTRELSAWQKAAERAGGSAEGITAQLKESQSESAKYASGITPATIQAFAKYGGNFDAFKSGNTYLLERSRIIADMYAKSPARAALAAQELGISEDNYNLIKQGPAAIQALIDAQMKNSVVTEADAKKAQELQNKLLDLRDTLKATAERVIFALMPAIEALVAKFQEFADWALAHKDEIADWVKNAAIAIVNFGKAVSETIDDLGGWKVILAAIVALNLLPTIASFLSLAAAITAIGTASTGVVAGAGARGLLATMGRFLGVGAALALHTDSLGAGEQEELARRRAIGDKGPVFTGSRAPLPGSTGSQNAIMDSLMAKGWTRAQAAGITATLKQESSFNPAAIGDGGQAYGIGQWHPPRQADFKKQFGKDIRGSTTEEQLAFLDWEMRNTEKSAGDRLKNATSAANAGAIVSGYYARPGDRAGEMSRRSQMAATIEAQEAARSAAWAAGNPDIARAAGAGRGSQGVSSNSSEVNIQKIEVVTQATDATGIARDMGGALRKNSLVSQANTGLQ